MRRFFCLALAAGAICVTLVAAQDLDPRAYAKVPIGLTLASRASASRPARDQSRLEHGRGHPVWG
jgi:hypothetical protein